MTQLTLQQLFGVNVTQTSQSLIITKADLPLLTPSSNNTAESLLVAVLLKVYENFQGQLTDLNGNKITDPQGVTVDYNNSILYQLLLAETWNGFIQQKLDGYVIRDTLIINQYLEYADTEFS